MSVFDPELARLAATLKHLAFDIDETEREDFRTKQLLNVSIFPNSRTWRVRIFLRGKLRVVGTTSDGPSAARYADAARFFFWPYRLRSAHPPTEADMNYSVENALSDIQHVEGLQPLLQSIVQHLQLELPNPAEAKKEDRRTVRSDVNLRFAKQEELICALSELLVMQFHIAEKQRTEIQESLARIEKLFAPIGGGAFQQSPDFTPSVDNSPTTNEDKPL